MPSEDERAAFIEQLIERARERWRGVVPDDELERHLARTRVQLFTHPVAMEYVARAMPRQPPKLTEERGEGQEVAGEKAAGGRS